jgi:hypothetical protein
VPTAAEATAAATPTLSSSQPVASPAETKTGLQQIYYNSEGDFSLLLPVDWVVGEAGATPLGNQTPLGPDTPEGGTILVTAATTTLEDALAQVMCDICEVREQREITLQSSQITVQRVNLRGEGTRDIEWFFIESGDKLVVLSINNPRTGESLEAIIHSFMPGQLTDVGIEALVAVQAGREHLAGQFGLDPYNVIVESIEAGEWENTCMGADLPSQLCEPIPTKGYALELRLGGQVFPYRANEDGTRAVPLFPIGT